MIDAYLIIISFMIITAVVMLLLRPSRIFDFPVFTHLVYGGVFVPQLVVVYSDTNALPMNSMEQFLLLSILCLAMSWIGFGIKPLPVLSNLHSIRLDYNRLAFGGWILLVLANIIAIVLFRTELEQNSEGQATGSFTIVVFLSNITLIPSYAIMILLFLRRFSVSAFIGILLAAWFQIYVILVYGRREATVVAGMIPMAMVYWVHKIEPPRWLVLPAMILFILMVQVIGQYRSAISEYGAGAIVDFNPLEEFNRRLDSGHAQAPEVCMACYQIDYASKLPNLNYGAGFWNRIIFHMVPAQIVGRDLKSDLLLRVNPLLFATNSEHPPAAPPGTVPTAIADTYAEFGYLGCLLFALISYFYKCLRIVCERGGDAGSLIYSVTLTSAMVSLTHGGVEFLPAFMSYMMTLAPIIWYSIRKSA